ncbi:MAG: M16 family metallopeptidase [Gemmatimonadota bacterium]
MNPILAGFDVREAHSENGLRVLVREDHSAPVAAIYTHVRAGYFDEPDELVGISHVLEHMYFKGTPTRGPGQIAQQTKSAGGYLNASTIYDHTSYYTVLPASSLEEGLDIQSDALLNSVIDAEELRKELLVIIQEANRKLDNPAARARETLYELMFDRHRMRRWRIGQEAQLRTFTRADVSGFFERHYRAPAIILVVSGAVDAADVFDLVERKYAGIRQGDPPHDRGPPEPRRHEFRFCEIAGDVVQTRIEIGWHTEPALHADTAYIDMLALILGQGRASHLYRRVREAGLASGISAHNYTPAELGLFGVTAEAEPADTRACIDAIFETIEAARDGSISDSDVARAQSVLEARTLRGLETMEGQASFLAEWAALGDWRLAIAYLERIMSARRADIERVARYYLASAAASVLSYRPESAAALSLTAADAQRHAR